MRSRSFYFFLSGSFMNCRSLLVCFQHTASVSVQKENCTTLYPPSAGQGFPCHLLFTSQLAAAIPGRSQKKEMSYCHEKEGKMISPCEGTGNWEARESLLLLHTPCVYQQHNPGDRDTHISDPNYNKHFKSSVWHQIGRII